jgi:NADH-quinone oxidoreductase subunit C
MALDENPNATLGEQGRVIDSDVAVQLTEQLAALRDHIVEAFADVEIGVLGYRGELTLEVPAGRVIDLLRFCRDDEAVRCELLADLSAVHWPGGTQVAKAQETTGWPTFEREQVGRIDICYIVRSLAHNHWLRIRTSLPDEDPTIASAVEVYRSANYMEREVYDFFGVRFTGHPNLKRIEMPDDWVGHPQRKDYPLGGVEVMYKGATIPPPDERRY